MVNCEVAEELSSSPVALKAEHNVSKLYGEHVYAIAGSIVVRTSAIFGFGTIMLCYIIAVSLGHVPAWLPMISDCAVDKPERYPFRIGIITAASLLALGAYSFYCYLHTSTLGGIKDSDKVAVVIAAVSCFFLACVGAINEQENNTLHSGSAVIFFTGYLIYMLMTTYRLWHSSNPERQISPVSLAIKIGLAAATFVALITLVYGSTDWGKYKLTIAICEWTAVICIISYNLSYTYEFDGDLFMQIFLKDYSNSAESRC